MTTTGKTWTMSRTWQRRSIAQAMISEGLREDTMELTRRGLSAREIAARLGICERTVVRYRTRTRQMSQSGSPR